MKKVIVSFLIILSLTSEAWAQFRSTIDLVNPVNFNSQLTKGLISWWINLPALSGGNYLIAQDIVRRNFAATAGFASPPTATSGWGRTTTRQGGFGEWRLDGSNDYLIGAQNSQFTLHAVPFTLAAWFLDDTAAGSMGDVHRIIIWNDGTNSISLMLGASNSGTTRAIGVQNTSGSTVQGSSATIGTGWIHAAVTFDGTSTYVIYINGFASSGAAIPSVTTYNSAGNISFGTGDGGGQYINGRMDDIRIYRRKLVAKEILELYKDSRMYYTETINRISFNSYFASILTNFFQFFRSY